MQFLHYKSPSLLLTLLATTTPLAAQAIPSTAVPLATPVSAASDVQNQMDANAATLGDLIVTARRVTERVQDIPLAVTAVSGAALQQRNVLEIRDLSAIAPNLSIQSGNTGSGTAALSIRGQNSTTVSLAVDSAVGLYVDGVNIPRTFGIRGALVDIGRVEVLRGPQGTLYGRNTTGGALGIYTNDPTDRLGASVQISGGNYNSYNVLGVFNVPIAEGLNGRFVATRSGNKGFGEQVNLNRRVATQDNSYGRAKLDYRSDALHLNLSADYFALNTRGIISRLAGLTPATATSPFGGGNGAREVALELGLASSNAALTALQTSNPGQFNSIMQQASATLASYVGRGGYYQDFGYVNPLGKPSEAVKGGTIAFNADYELSDSVSLRSITGFRYFKSHGMTDNDGTPFMILEYTAKTNDRFFSEEFQILGDTGPLKWVIGAFYSDEGGTTTDNNRTLARINPTITITDGDIDSSSYAFFGQANWKITDALTFTGGLRWTKETKSLLSRNRTTTACTIAPVFRTGSACEARFKDSFSDPSWLASLDYKITPDILVYAKASRGFRGGGQNTRASGANTITYQSFAPETLTEYEIGLKSEFFDRRVRLNLAAFYDDYTDIQRSVVVVINPATGAIGQLQTNAAKAKLKGLEAELTVRVTDDLVLNGTYGGFKHKYKSFVDLTGDRSGEPWPAPHYNYTLNANYSRASNFGRYLATVTWAAQGKTNFSPSALQRAQLTQPAYGLLNARVGVSIDHWDTEIALFGRNVLDKDFRQNGINLEALGFNRTGPGEPRTYGIQVTKRFGAI